MLDIVASSEREVVPARKIAGTVAGTFLAGGDHFETRAVEALTVSFQGVTGDFHAGFTRRSGGREPWYPRGTEMRNERQLSVVAPDELARVAGLMGLDELRPEWIGANLLLDGIPQLSFLPAGALLFFEGGATLKVDGQNKPCRIAGRQIGLRAELDEPRDAELAFPKAAKRLRGLVAWVERPGVIRPGEKLSARIPEQWIY